MAKNTLIKAVALVGGVCAVATYVEQRCEKDPVFKAKVNAVKEFLTKTCLEVKVNVSLCKNELDNISASELQDTSKKENLQWMDEKLAGMTDPEAGDVDFEFTDKDIEREFDAEDENIGADENMDDIDAGNLFSEDDFVDESQKESE